MIDQLFILANYPWWVWVFVGFVSGMIGYGVYLAWYHLYKYPNGKPKNRKL
jgi:hypothetical protein